ncbi:MAG: SWIM zinc finger family protein, partial [Nocardiopsaceae bacterium]|nr:SWIM zinc finger family protein [Nocardiopsaceae bacterium]
MATATKPAVTEADLRSAAGERSFERGTGYLRAVSGIEAVGNQVVATVSGSSDYLVVLTMPDKAAGTRLRGECGCPYGQEGFFCKHCVAVGLALLRDAAVVSRRRPERAAEPRQRPDGALVPNQRRDDAAAPHQRREDGRLKDKADGKSASRSRPSPTPSRASDLSCWLNSLSQEELVAVVCDQVVEDDDWRRRLELRAAAAASDITAVRARAESMLRGDDDYGTYKYAGQYGYLEGPESWYYARRVRQVTETVKLLIEAGDSGDAMVIAEEALAAIRQSSRHASDRAGVIRGATAELAAA